MTDKTNLVQQLRQVGALNVKKHLEAALEVMKGVREAPEMAGDTWAAEVVGAIGDALDSNAHTIEGEQLPHIYVSTGCRHGQHHYCKSETGVAGQKHPGTCKFCFTQCLCDCHNEPNDETPPPPHQKGANAEECPGCIHRGFDTLAYPWICPGDTE
jgi:hypothetical protein